VKLRRVRAGKPPAQAARSPPRLPTQRARSSAPGAPHFPAAATSSGAQSPSPSSSAGIRAPTGSRRVVAVQKSAWQDSSIPFCTRGTSPGVPPLLGSLR
jgi:hypothetical protein